MLFNAKTDQRATSIPAKKTLQHAEAMTPACKKRRTVIIVYLISIVITQ